MTPETVNTSGVVGQATSFDLTLTGGSPYTYTQTFGNICDVSINNDTATVTITPTTSGTLTGSITFNNEATCNITIDVAEPEPPQGGLEPTTLSPTMEAEDTSVFQYTLTADFDIYTERIRYRYEKSGDDEFRSAIRVQGKEPPETGHYDVEVETQNETDSTLTGVINVYAEIYNIQSDELLRTYTATINLTINP